MIGRGRAIRARREALGLSVEEVGRHTRIPVEHIASIERGDLDALPPGPYADAWARALESYLGLPTPGAQAAPSPARPGPPMWAVRVVAGVALGALLAVIAWQVAGGPSSRAAVSPPAAPAADQQVVVRALRTTRLAVRADGELVREGELPGGEEIEVVARERIELDVAAAGALRIDYNGERIVPLGRQDEPRRLVFVDDGEAR